MTVITTDDGLRTEYTEHGDPRGRPVVLLAGFKAPATSWCHQVPALTDAGYRVFAVDLPGHGAAGPLPPGMTMDRRGDCVHALLEHRDLEGAVLVGGSMGASTVWAYTSRHGTGRLAGAVSVDQTPKMLNTEDWPYGFYGYDEGNADTYFAEGIPDTGHGTPLWRRGVRLFRTLRAMRGTDPALTPAELELLNDHAGRDWREAVAGLDVSALFVAGAESELWPAEHAAAAAGPNPRAGAAVVREAGHAVNMERPGAFNAGLLRFLARVEGF
ncbi:alpha/beta hydrolase [Glycomyces fuscus]|nr:alpha/beta hydrolase [Glycomyces fuscus]